MASFQSSSCTSNIPLAIHSPLDGRLGCFLVLAILNSAAMNFGVLFSFWVPFFSGYVPRSRIAGSYDNSIFSFLRNFHTLLHSGFTSLYTYQQCRTVKQMLIFKNFLGWPLKSLTNTRVGFGVVNQHLSTLDLSKELRLWNKFDLCLKFVLSWEIIPWQMGSQRWHRREV